jgi:eukaryotic-like serine/threonine-protein kinase
MDYTIGSRAGDYEVLQVLGAGGMGKVYKVRNIISDRVEAMKVLLPNLEGDPELADRFFREIKVQARLEHPNIAALYTALRLDNQLVMLMEYVEGVTLEEMLKHGPIPIDKAVDYIAQVLSALSYAHGRGIVHRDLKPANMILTPKGVVKLMDFGIAKLTADRKLTQTGATVGSLYYMSPEQIKGATDLDSRSDLYSLGVSLYEIVTGARPFQGDSEYSIMAAHLEKNPVPPIEIDASMPPALSEIVLMSIEKDPAKRFQTADAFRAALLNVGQRPSAPPPPPVVAAPPPLMAAAPPPPAFMPPPPAPAARQGGHRGLYIALGSLLTIVVLVLAAMQIPKFRRTSAESPATQAPASVTAPAQTPAATAVDSSTPAPAQTTQEPAVQQPQVQERQVMRSEPATKPAVRRETVTHAAPPSQPVEPAAQEAPPQQAAREAAPTPASAPANTAALGELREQLMLLGTRAGAAKTSLSNLQRQQNQQGLGLRADIAAAAQRMEYYLDETEAALKRGDAAAAKKNLDAAEKVVSKIESFLGH